MTETQVYDLALSKMKDPAVVKMGNLCIVGEWVKLSEFDGNTILKTKLSGVRVLGTGATWDEAAVKAGLVVVGGQAALLIAAANQKPVLTHKEENVRRCRTYGCNEPRSDRSEFCPKCFQVNISERDIHEPSPPSRKE